MIRRQHKIAAINACRPGMAVRCDSLSNDDVDAIFAVIANEPAARDAIANGARLDAFDAASRGGVIEHRHDASGLGKARRDARGFLIVPARAARTGILTYRRADGSTFKELRTEDDVFDPASLETYASAPVTVGHRGDVTPSNVRDLEVGVVSGTVRRDGEFVATELSIRDGDTIAKVESGELVELSAGYTVKVDKTPGIYNGERYDQKQTNIRVNHLSLLPKGNGRSGGDVRVRLDDGSAVLVDVGSAYELRADRSQEVNDFQRRLDEAEHKRLNAWRA